VVSCGGVRRATGFGRLVQSGLERLGSWHRLPSQLLLSVHIDLGGLDMDAWLSFWLLMSGSTDCGLNSVGSDGDIGMWCSKGDLNGPSAGSVLVLEVTRGWCTGIIRRENRSLEGSRLWCVWSWICRRSNLRLGHSFAVTLFLLCQGRVGRQRLH
jgi:hypothetical protein